MDLLRKVNKIAKPKNKFHKWEKYVSHFSRRVVCNVCGRRIPSNFGNKQVYQCRGITKKY